MRDVTPRKRGRPRTVEYVTYQDAANLLGVSKYTVARWVKSGRLAARETKGGYHKLLRTTVEDFKRNNQT